MASTKASTLRAGFAAGLGLGGEVGGGVEGAQGFVAVGDARADLAGHRDQGDLGDRGLLDRVQLADEGEDLGGVVLDRGVVVRSDSRQRAGVRAATVSARASITWSVDG